MGPYRILLILLYIECCPTAERVFFRCGHYKWKFVAEPQPVAINISVYLGEVSCSRILSLASMAPLKGRPNTSNFKAAAFSTSFPHFSTWQRVPLTEMCHFSHLDLTSINGVSTHSLTGTSMNAVLIRRVIYWWYKHSRMFTLYCNRSCEEKRLLSCFLGSWNLRTELYFHEIP